MFLLNVVQQISVLLITYPLEGLVHLKLYKCSGREGSVFICLGCHCYLGLIYKETGNGQFVFTVAPSPKKNKSEFKSIHSTQYVNFREQLLLIVFFFSSLSFYTCFYMFLFFKEFTQTKTLLSYCLLKRHNCL